MTKQIPTILVIIGITGDLAGRKLLPAIEKIAKAGELPEELRIIGITRRNVTAEDVLAGKKAQLPFIAQHLEMYTMDLSSADAYVALRGHLDSVASEFSAPAQYLFYLSVPPEISRPVIRLLGDAGFADIPTKLLLEKPFGFDLVSAEELISQLQEKFREDQIYRIDHYLAKEMTQNMVVFRNGNSLFKRTWNADFIERIEIIASEKIDIENRVAFYEQTGALRDVVQSHLLQLAALALMKLPEQGNYDHMQALRLEALQSLQLAEGEVHTNVVRGQYEGYDQEVGNIGSETETFVSLKLQSNDEQWTGVPIYLITGKALAEKYTEVRICYKLESEDETNKLVLRIQPHEGISFDMWSKRPGYDNSLKKVALTFNYYEESEEPTEAYERVFLDAIRSDRTLFTSSQEVLESWRILQPVLQSWHMSAADLKLYPKNSSFEDVLKL